MRKLIFNGKILSPERLPDDFGILIEGDQIIAVDQMKELPSGLPKLDAKGKWIVPGFIDIHVHGSSGSDTMDSEISALNKMSQFLAMNGVTSFLPTTSSASNQVISSAIENVRICQGKNGGARILGIHLEGPYLNHEHKGAQSSKEIRTADPDEFMPWLETGLVKLITVAPEVDGVMDLIETGRKMGVRFAVGHSGASYEEMIHAIDTGLTQATHIFNGMAQLHHRDPGVLGAVLTDDRVFAQVIVDGIHIHPAIVKLIFIAKGVERTMLITDAIRAAGAADGKHQFGDQIVTVRDGIARTSTGNLAGSTLTMAQALKNTCNFTGKSLDMILPSATSATAASIGLQDEVGSIKAGLKADIVFLDDDFEPQLTMVSGKIVFQK